MLPHPTQGLPMSSRRPKRRLGSAGRGHRGPWPESGRRGRHRRAARADQAVRRLPLVDDQSGTVLAVDEIVLRPWRPTDAADVLTACQDPEIAHWVDIPQPFLAAHADAFI